MDSRLLKRLDAALADLDSPTQAALRELREIVDTLPVNADGDAIVLGSLQRTTDDKVVKVIGISSYNIVTGHKVGSDGLVTSGVPVCLPGQLLNTYREELERGE